MSFDLRQLRRADGVTNVNRWKLAERIYGRGGICLVLVWDSSLRGFFISILCEYSIVVEVVLVLEW
jgi:hypothetical protein